MMMLSHFFSCVSKAMTSCCEHFSQWSLPFAKAPPVLLLPLLLFLLPQDCCYFLLQHCLSPFWTCPSLPLPSLPEVDSIAHCRALSYPADAYTRNTAMSRSGRAGAGPRNDRGPVTRNRDTFSLPAPRRARPWVCYRGGKWDTTPDFLPHHFASLFLRAHHVCSSHPNRAPRWDSLDRSSREGGSPSKEACTRRRWDGIACCRCGKRQWHAPSS